MENYPLQLNLCLLSRLDNFSVYVFISSFLSFFFFLCVCVCVPSLQEIA